MRYTTVKNLHEGMILGKTLFGIKGEKLLLSDCIIKKEYIQKIQALGYAGIYIKDNFSKDIEIEEIITPELKVSAIQKLKDIYVLDFEKKYTESIKKIGDVQVIVSNIVDNVISNKDVIINMLDLKVYDDYTYYHSVNVTVLAIAIGVGMGLSKDDLNVLGMAAMLHDIGKKFVPKSILDKPGSLTNKEYADIKEHAFFGYMYIKENFGISPKAYIAILQHHERFDGSGYPDRKKGKEISAYARILAVVDVYDALISKRPYHEPNLPSEALEYIMGGSGTLFDPDIVRIFVNRVAAYPVGTGVILSNGMQGLVVENFEGHSTRPRVKILNDEDEIIYIDLKDNEKFSNVTIVNIV